MSKAFSIPHGKAIVLIQHVRVDTGTCCSQLMLSLLTPQELQEDLQEILQLQRRIAEYQLACYPPNGSQYVKHRDALPDDGYDPMQRKVALPFSVPSSLPACQRAFIHRIA